MDGWQPQMDVMEMGFLFYLSTAQSQMGQKVEVSGGGGGSRKMCEMFLGEWVLGLGEKHTHREKETRLFEFVIQIQNVLLSCAKQQM